MNFLSNEIIQILKTPEIVLSLNAIERSDYYLSKLNDQNETLYTLLEVNSLTFLAETTFYVDPEGKKNYLFFMTTSIDDVDYVPILSDDSRTALNQRTRWLIHDISDTDYIKSQIEFATEFSRNRYYRHKQSNQVFLLLYVSLLQVNGTCVLAFNYVQVDETGVTIHPAIIHTRPAYDFYGNRHFQDISVSIQT